MKVITTKKLSQILKLSQSLVNIHLCLFEKYRIKKNGKSFFIYNKNFLIDLKNFYYNLSKQKNPRYKRYTPVYLKLEKILNTLFLQENIEIL